MDIKIKKEPEEKDVSKNEKKEKLPLSLSPLIESNKQLSTIDNEKKTHEEKEEKPLLKSSAEILNELFSSFNAAPPLLDGDNSTSHKKHKKSKKKHKKKQKKKKKKSGSNSSDSSSDDSKKHKRKSKKKRKSSESSNDDSKAHIKRKKLSNDIANNPLLDFKSMFLKDDLLKVVSEETKSDLIDVKQEKTSTDKKSEEVGEKENSNTGNNEVKDMSQGEKPKIQIKDLKNSSVFHETMKEVEEKSRKQKKSDDGELSDDEVFFTPERKNDDLDDLNLTESTDEEIRAKKRKHAHRNSKDRNHRKHRSREKSRKDSDEKHSQKDHHRSTSDHRSRSDHRNEHRESSRDRHTKKSWYDLDEQKLSSSHRSIKDRLGFHHTKRDDKHSSKTHHHHHRSGSYDKHRHRSRSRSRSPRSQFDKKKLLEIARKNAITMLKNGSLPGYVGLGPQAQEKVLAAIKSGGKTIDELTDFCKNLSREEALGELSSVGSDDEQQNSDTERPFNHPFQLKERPTSIIMNIPNSTVIPVKTPQEKAMDKSTLLMQFPVSSGQQHRRTENEWIPVSPKKPEPIVAPIPKAKPKPPVSIPKKAFVSAPNTNPFIPQIPPKPLAEAVTVPVSTPVVFSAPVEQQTQPSTDVFPQITDSNIDIGSVVSQRLMAMRKLQENPNDVQALGEMYRAQQEMQNWAISKQTPGQFTGSTGAQILSAAELASGYQAWARKDQLVSATPVSGGMGMHLLQKMGWRPGEGLGKEKNGALQPLMLEVKLDKKGLVANEEVKNKRPAPVKKPVPIKPLEGKHPVSLLGEYACKRKLGVPVYELCFECGPSHKKNFLFKVKLNGIEYQPSVASPNKKQAKADAATICLQQLGVLPS